MHLIFPWKLGVMTCSQAKLFGPSTLCVGHQGHVFYQVNKIKLDIDIKEVSFQLQFPSILFGSFYLSPNVLTHFLSPCQSALGAHETHLCSFQAPPVTYSKNLWFKATCKTVFMHSHHFYFSTWNFHTIFLCNFI